MKQIWSRLKPYCPLVTLGGTLLFLAKALKEHTAEVAAIRIDAIAWATLAIALGVTMLAHSWSGWVWTWILRLNQPVNTAQLIQIYLQTNIAKYIPGNFWHYYGRILAAKDAGIAASAATLSVLLEPLLMAAAALIFFLVASLVAGTNRHPAGQGWPILGLMTVLIAIHPWVLNVAVNFLGRLKAKSINKNAVPAERTQRAAPKQRAIASINQIGLKRYPLRPLFGELGFLGLRSAGFLLTLLAFSPLELSQMPLLLKTFSLAWLLGTIVPGAPGGLGVFEATAVALLQQHFAAGILLSAIASYRLVSILAEAACAGLAWVDQRLSEC